MAAWLEFIHKESKKPTKVLGPIISKGRAVSFRDPDTDEMKTWDYDAFAAQFEPVLPKPTAAATKTVEDSTTPTDLASAPTATAAAAAPPLPERVPQFSGPVPVTMNDQQFERLLSVIANTGEAIRSDLRRFFGPAPTTSADPHAEPAPETPGT